MAAMLNEKIFISVYPDSICHTIGITGVLDALGNLLFSIASHLGRLDVSAVLGSLYPAATVLLAWLFLKEKLRFQQWVGVGAAFVALVLISV